MKITVLVDNRASSNCKAEHGLSFYIEYNNKKIVFDTGQSDIAAINAHKLGIDLNEIDLIVLSHGHYDHGNGLNFFPKNKPLLVHSNIFTKRYKRTNNQYIGLDLSESDIENSFKVTRSSKPVEIEHQAWFMGEIPRITNFEPISQKYIFKNGDIDPIIDDTALVFSTHKGTIIVAGCSHSGICNIVLKAKVLIPNNPIAAIVGGFHLSQIGERLKKTIKFFKQHNIKKLYPSHCTHPKVICHLSNHFDVSWISSGDVIEF
ncbi:MAG TPA: MBL fold metallo-hydrolase [Salinivirgaceae bacterium]|nr:MBL fold metallo-hydrolase [Salinivirgaceae bacterium]